MATQCMTESCYPQMQLPSGFSIVVDDVDGDQDQVGEDEVDEDVVEEAQEALTLDGEAPPCQCGTECGSGVAGGRRGSREMCSERIRQIQVEAQSRKNEFAKLLEEHAQVVLRVKQMEQREHQQQKQQQQQQQQQQQHILQQKQQPEQPKQQLPQQQQGPQTQPLQSFNNKQ